MKRFYRRADLWALILFYILAVNNGLTTFPQRPQYYQRCRSLPTVNVTEDALQSFVPSSCELCTYVAMQNNSLYPHTGKSHIAVLLTSRHPSTFETTMIMVAGLLTSGHRVTILYQHFELKSDPSVMRDLFHLIPCKDQFKARALLTLRSFYIDPQRFRCKNNVNYYQQETRNSIPPGDVFACEIRNAALLIRALQMEMQPLMDSDDPFDLVLTDGVFVAGMLVAELYKLPTLALMEGEENLRRILGPLLSDKPWYFSLARTIQDRLQLLDQLEEYVGLNRVRRMLGLERLRILADFWKTNRLLVTSHDVALSVPNLLRIPLPLLPPCVPCQALEPVVPPMGNSNSTPALVIAVAFPNTSHGRTLSRTLLQALSMARASLQEMAFVANEELDFEQEVKPERWSGPSDFIVVRFGDPLEELQPPFVKQESLQYFLDSLVRHMPVAGIVTRCSGADLLQSLGPPLLCLDNHQSPRELATAILKLFGMQSSTEPKDGLAWFISLMDTFTSEEMKTNGRAKTINERIQSLLTVSNDGSSKEQFESSTFAVTSVAAKYLAWLILISSVLYVYLKAIINTIYPPGKKNARRYHTQRDIKENSTIHITTTLILEEIVERLPELDHVFAMWKSWFWQELARLQAPPSPSRTVENNTVAKNKRRSNIKKKH